MIQKKTVQKNGARPARSSHTTERKRAKETLRETTQTLQAAVQASPLAVITVDLQGNVTTWNPAAEQTFGWSEQEALGHPNPIIPEDRQDEFRANLDAVLQGNLLYQVETRRRKKDGSLIDVSLSTAAMRNATGDIIGTMGILADITERKQAEEALRESEQRYRPLAENVKDVIWTADMDLNFTYISPSHHLLRRAPGQPMPQRLEEMLTPASFEIVMKALAEELAIENMDEKDLSRSRTLELENYRGDGSTVWVEDKMTFLRDPDGRPVGILGVTRDITERKRADQELRNAKEFSEGLLAAMQDGLSVLDSRGVSVHVNPAFCKMTGFSREEIVGVGPPRPYWPAEEMEEIERALQKLLSDQPQDHELTFMRKNGQRFPVIVSPSYTRDPQGNVVHRFATFKDITERKQAEEALRESETRFRTLSESSFEGIAIHRKGKILEANQPLATMFGYELSEVIGMHALDFTVPESRDLLLHNIVSGYRDPFELTGLRKDGTTFPVEVCGRAISYQGRAARVAAIRDITEHKQAEEALQKAREELEARAECQMERGNPYGLTFRELTVLHIVAAGKADKEIAGQLGITTLTASKHLANILNKMSAASRTEAGVRALREGLLD